MFRVQRVDPRQHEKPVEEENRRAKKKKEKKKDDFQTDGWQLGSSGIQKPDSGPKNPIQKGAEGVALRKKGVKKKIIKKKHVKC